jgi:hypothetical protein
LIFEPIAQVLGPFVHPPTVAYSDCGDIVKMPPLSRGALGTVPLDWLHYRHPTCATKMEASGLCG